MEFWFTEKHTDHTKFSIQVKEQLYHGVTKYQTIDFFDTYEFGRCLTLDGSMMVNEKDEFIYHEMIVHVAMATNPSIENVLVIGGGDGGTVRELTRYPHIKKIDMVEVDEQVVRLSQKYLPLTSSKLKDERVCLYFDDGTTFVSGVDQAYDLIIVDSTDPIGPGEGLFSKAFYENCYNALTEKGILVNQHESPYYEEDSKEMIRSHKKIKSMFEISKVYQFHMPTYPSGHWLFGFASKSLDPIEDAQFEKWLSFGLETKYYNINIHKGSFYLPTYVLNMLDEV